MMVQMYHFFDMFAMPFRETLSCFKMLIAND